MISALLHDRLRDAMTAGLNALDRKLASVADDLKRQHRSVHEVEALMADLDDPHRDEYHALTQHQTVVRKALGEFDGPDVPCTCATREVNEPCLLHAYSDAGLH